MSEKLDTLQNAFEQELKSNSMDNVFLWHPILWTMCSLGIDSMDIVFL